jgi:hypothetical protein
MKNVLFCSHGPRKNNVIFFTRELSYFSLLLAGIGAAATPRLWPIIFIEKLIKSE